MTSSAAEMGNSGVGPAQRRESGSKQTVDKGARRVSNSQFDLPGKAEHAQHDEDNTGEGTLTGNVPNDDVGDTAAVKAAGRRMKQHNSAVLKPSVEAEPVAASGNGWSLDAPDTGPGPEVRESGSMAAAAEGLVREADSASAGPEADAESAAVPKRPRLSATQVSCNLVRTWASGTHGVIIIISSHVFSRYTLCVPLCRIEITAVLLALRGCP